MVKFIRNKKLKNYMLFVILEIVKIDLRKCRFGGNNYIEKNKW